MNKWFEKIKKIFERWFNKPDPEPPVPPKPDEPVTPPQDSNDAIPIGSISWLGRSYAKATATAKLMSSHITSRQHTISDAPPASWPKKVVKVQVQGIICLFYEQGGRIVGGKYDWLRPGQKVKGLENLHDGYNGHSMPAKGSQVWTCIVSVDEKQRSDIVAVTWK
jgi:hypothetical protein